MKAKKLTSVVTLERGQLWKFEKENIEILLMGKLLAHYRRSVDGEKRGFIKMERISVIQDYLKRNGGRLVKNGGAVKAAA